MSKKANYGDCSICGGHVTPKLVEKVCSRNGRLVALVEGVPAGVCDQCGERYYEAGVLKHTEKLLEKHKRTRTVSVPVTKYAA